MKPISILHYGFTLPELLVVMAIVGILSAIAFPSYQSVTAANRRSTEINGLSGDFQYARSEAVKQGQTVTICASANATTATPTCSVAADWKVGWIVFSDANGNQAVDAGETILRVQAALPGTDTLKGVPAALNAVTFNREGFVSNAASGTGTITLHDAAGTPAFYKCVSISAAGNLQLNRTSTGGACP